MVWCGKSPTCWMTYPIRRRSRSGSLRVTSSPCSRIVPDVGSTILLIIFSVVVFPQPDGPTRITISPSAMLRSSASTAGSAWPG